MAVSARRATIAEQKARRQLIMALIAAVVIGLIFVFVVVPLLFSAAVSLSRKGSVTSEPTDTIPPQRPVLQPPAEFTTQENLELTGFTEPQAEARLYVDYAEAGVATADEDGAFRFTAPLTEGKHELWIIAADAAGNQSIESAHYPVTLDKTVPTITLDRPEDGAVFTLPRERVLTVQGITSEKAQVKVNGAVVQTGVANAFSLTIQLANGSNELVLTATDEAGNVSEEKKITVEYRP